MEAFVTVIFAFLEKMETILSIRNHFKKQPATKEIEQIPDTVVSPRFVQLFKKHGIHRNQIPRFFGHGLTLDNISNNVKLLVQLSPEILQAAAELFAIRLEWLEGADDQLYDIHNFYKHPEDYAKFLRQLNAKGEYKVMATLVLSAVPNEEEDALLILQEDIGFIGDEAVFRYHLCSGWLHRYYKCRADITTCIAMTLNQRVSVRGHWMHEPINRFCEGKGFISDLYQLPFAYQRNCFFRKQYTKIDWHPDHWIFNTKDYLDELDEGEFGLKITLEIWLYYFDKGYMETGYGRNNVADEFRAALKKYDHARNR